MIIKDILEDKVDESYYINNERTEQLIRECKESGIEDSILLQNKPNKIQQIGNISKGGGWKNPQTGRVYSVYGLCPTLNAMQGGNREPKILENGERIRKLTPLECWRTQGFSDEDFYKSEKILSKTKLYERAGRGICVPMLEDIFSNFYDLTKEDIKLFEAFSGVGSQRMALRNLEVNYESVGILEVDKNAILAYDAIHNGSPKEEYSLKKEEKIKEMRDINIAYNFSTYKDEMPRSEKDIDALYSANKRSRNYGDISTVDVETLPNFNFFTYSFPCKNISIAGNQKGLDKGSGTQSSLVWECEKIIKAKKPKYLMMENVKNLCGKDNMDNFQAWIDILQSHGYESEWKVYNAKDYNAPQNRERVIMMSRLIGE